MFRRANHRHEIKKVMVYSPNLGGHRHIYCRKFIDFFRAKNMEVYFVFCGIITNCEFGIYTKYKTRHVENLNYDEHVYMIDLSENFKGKSEELDLIVSLQQKYEIDLTLFVDGDILQGSLVKQLFPSRPKLSGKNYAVFIHSEFMYPGALPGNMERKNAFFHLLLFKYFNLLDGGLYSDENIVKRMKSEKYIHLCEVGNTHLENGDPNYTRNLFYASIGKKYRQFLKKHKDKDVILCFGDLEPRKGFDYLLQLVCDHDGLILVRVGRTKPEYHPDWQSIFNKEQLIMQDRLFELDTYVEDQKLFDMLFQSTRYILLPYKHFYRTSSVMMQALSYIKPVLVPDTGLLKSRVEENNLGRTFKHLSYPSFHDEFLKLQKDSLLYIENIKRYIQNNFTTESFRATCEKMLH